MCQAVGCGKRPEFALFIQHQAIVRARPHAIAVHRDAVNAVIRQAICGGEVLPTKLRHALRVCGANREKQNWYRAFHRRFKYSMRSFNSSFVKSLLMPCVSFGLNTVQISSSVRAEPSCRYGAL